MARTETANHGLDTPQVVEDLIDFAEDFKNFKEYVDSFAGGLGAARSGFANSIGGTSYASNTGKIISSSSGGTRQGVVIGLAANDDATLTFQDHPADPTAGTNKVMVGYHDSGDGFAVHVGTDFDATFLNNHFTINSSGNAVFKNPITVGTSLTTPLIIGGTGTTSTLTLKTTTGVGTTNADMIFLVGNNGGTEAIRILNNGDVGINTSTPNYCGYSNRTVTLKSVLSGVFELATVRADGSSASAGVFGWAFDANTGTAAKQIAAIEAKTDGGVATDRGGIIHFRTRAGSGGTGVGAVGRWYIDSFGNLYKDATNGGSLGLSTDTDLVQLTADNVLANGTLKVLTALLPNASDGAAVGSATLMWSDLYLASGAVINFSNGNVTATHSTGSLAFSTGVTFGGTITPVSNDGGALGSTSLMWSDLFLASGSVINWNNGDVTLTHSTDLLTISGGNVRFVAPIAVGASAPITNCQINFGALTPGVGTVGHFLLGYGANTSWPFSLSTLYDGSYVDLYLCLNGFISGGTRSAPTFTGGNGGGSFIRSQGDGIPQWEAGFYTSGAGVSGTTAISFDNSGNFTIYGDLVVNGGDIGPTGDTDLIQIAANAVTINGSLKFAGTNSTGTQTTTLGTNAPAGVVTLTPYTWITVIAGDGSTCYIPLWK